jgi:uncharacterized membrane protein
MLNETEYIMTGIVDERGARTAMGLAISSFITAWFLPFVGIVLGIISLRIGKKAGAEDNKVWAIMGIVINSLVALVAVILTVVSTIIVIKYAPDLEQCQEAMMTGKGFCFGRYVGAD